MSGLTASVLLRRAFSAADTGRVTDLLRRHADDVTETHKGRHWTFVAKNAIASLSVVSTATHPYEFEDELVANDLDFDDAPEAFMLAFPTCRDYDHDKCMVLARNLAELFGGVDCSIRSK